MFRATSNVLSFQNTEVALPPPQNGDAGRLWRKWSRRERELSSEICNFTADGTSAAVLRCIPGRNKRTPLAPSTTEISSLMCQELQAESTAVLLQLLTGDRSPVRTWRVPPPLQLDGRSSSRCATLRKMDEQKQMHGSSVKRHRTPQTGACQEPCHNNTDFLVLNNFGFKCPLTTTAVLWHWYTSQLP